MFYKDILDYDTQLKEEGKIEGEIKGKIEGKEETIRVAIRNKAPFALLEAMAEDAKMPRKRLDELIAQAAV